MDDLKSEWWVGLIICVIKICFEDLNKMFCVWF